MRETMRKARSDTPSVLHKTISRRMFCETGLAALSAELFSSKTLAFSKDGAATPLDASGLPTLDDMGTGWLDCGLLAQMPSLHNFHEMAACAPDLVGVNFLPGGQLYGDESGPCWPIYYSLPMCGMTIDGRSYNSTSCRWFAYQAVRRAQVGTIDVVITNRLVIEDTVVLWRVKFTNNGQPFPSRQADSGSEDPARSQAIRRQRSDAAELRVPAHPRAIEPRRVVGAHEFRGAGARARRPANWSYGMVGWLKARLAGKQAEADMNARAGAAIASSMDRIENRGPS